MTVIGVTIFSENEEGKRDVTYVELHSLLGAVRFISTYQPKNGYKIIKTITEEFDKLV